MDIKQKFFGLLEDLFVGVEVKGDSGVGNLLRLRSEYFNKFKKELEDKIDNIGTPAYDRLYSFFKSYFNESGSLFFANTPAWKKRFARISNKDVELFYKTKDLYYIKSQKVYNDLEIEIDNFLIRFDASNLGERKGNEKKDIEFLFSDYDGNNKLTFLVRYKSTQKYDESKTITGESESKKAREEILNNLEKYKENIIFIDNFVFKNIDRFESRGKIGDKFEMIIKEKTDNKLLKNLDITLTLKDYKSIKKLVNIKEEILEKAFKAYKKQATIDYFIHKNARAFLKEQFDLYIYDFLADDIDTIFKEDSLKELQNIKRIAYELIDKIADFEDELKALYLKPRFVRNSNYVITKDRLEKYELIDEFINHIGIKNQIQEWRELNLVDEDFKIEDIEDEKYQFLPFDTKYFKDLEIILLEKIDNLDDELDGRLIKSENFQALNTILPKFREKIDLIYIDPPFNTGDDFDYIDKFQDSTWLTLMENRISLAKELLSKRGSFYLHLDYNANYLGRFLCNEIFGKENFSNEIFWYYTNKIPDTRKKSFTNSTDIILSFAKDYKRKTFNWLFEKRDKPIKVSKMKKEKGKKIYLKDATGKGIYEERFERTMDNVWKIPLLHAQEEFIKFVTQKPEELLRRIIQSASNKNNIVIDFFTGSGTTIAVAQKLNRRWIGVEMGEYFYSVILPRIKKIIGGVKVGISKDVEYEGGSFFKYYELEQFEDILKNAKYSNDLETSPKMSYITEIDFEHEKLNYAFEKLYSDVDICETISNLVGEKIVKITKDKLILQNSEYDLNDLNFEKYPELKALIYWS